MFAAGLVKVLPSSVSPKFNEAEKQSDINCGVTNEAVKTTQLSATNFVDNTLDFGIQCKMSNIAPVAENDVITSNEDTTVTITILTNDTDVDGTIDVTTVDLDPATPEIQTTWNVENEGTYTVNTSGVVTFIPVEDFNGTASNVEYTVNDNEGLTSNIATITVMVSPVNDPPEADDDSATTDEDTPVVIDVLDGDTDIDGTIDSTSITGVTLPTDGTLSIDPVTGEITYIPNLDFYGIDTFEYSVCDNGGLCDTGIVTVTVIADSADLSVTKIVDNTTPIVGENIEFSIEVLNDGPSDATGVSVIDQLTAGYTYISHDASVGTYDSATGIWIVGNVGNGLYELLTITAKVNASGDYTNIAEVYSVDQGDPNSIPDNGDPSENDQDEVTTIPISLITFPEEFTPNGDGINDVFEVGAIEILYPDFSMEIVNRWGNKVYKYKHNGDPTTKPTWWNGYSDGRWEFGSGELPVGTYYYVIRFNDGEREPLTGWVYLKR